MAYALDLSPRQTSRTLEQAIRHEADVEFRPRTNPEDDSIFCRLASAEDHRKVKGQSELLLIPLPPDQVDPSDAETPNATAEPPPPMPDPDFSALVGVYCDAAILLGDQQFLFSSHVVVVDRPPGDDGGWRLHVVRPDQLQVAQRRRFWRFKPARSSLVQLNWKHDDQSAGIGAGWLCNVSTEGLACRTDRHVSDQLWIGSEVKVAFGLEPGNPHRFTLDAVLCSKTAAGTEGKCILGLQFLGGEGHESSAKMAETLRQHLLARCAKAHNAPKGADA